MMVQDLKVGCGPQSLAAAERVEIQLSSNSRIATKFELWQINTTGNGKLSWH
jgi:hypothetical protein